MANYSFEKNINRDERDLVVWSSRLSTDISPSIVFGCFTSNGNELSQIKNNDLKFFLELILHDEKIAQKAVLLPLPPGEDPDDPEMNNATYVSLITKTKLTRRHLAVVWNEEPAEPGNYFLFMNASGRLQGVAPAVKKGAITSRSGPRRYLPSMVQSGWEFRTKKKQKTDPQEKKTRIKRNPRVRKEVRARDIRCRVCGLEVHRRQRGGNFKGVQVAHVFALAAMSVAIDVLGKETADWLINEDPRGDTVRNAVLLCSVDHDYVDDFQVAYGERVVINSAGPVISSYASKKKLTDGSWDLFEKDNSSNVQAAVAVTQRMKIRRSYRFETSGAPAVKIGYDLYPASYQGDASIPDVNPKLLQRQFQTALFWHVAGLGRKFGQ